MVPRPPQEVTRPACTRVRGGLQGFSISRNNTRKVLMQPDRAPKLKYRQASGIRLTVELTTQAAVDILTIQDLLRRESSTPTVPVSRSVVTRRALRVYAQSLSRQAPGTIQGECARASNGTYIYKRQTPRINETP
jgi:hypothetical protein